MATAGTVGLRKRLEGVLKGREDQKRAEGDLNEVAHISELRQKFNELKKKMPVEQKVEVAPISALRRKFEEAARINVQSQPESDPAQQDVEEEKKPPSYASSSDANMEVFCVDKIEVESDLEEVRKILKVDN